MWPMLIATGAGAGLGLLNQQYKRKQEKENMMANAEAIRYSPWTKLNPTFMRKDDVSPWMAMLQGGYMGAEMGSQFGGAPAASPGTAAAAAAPEAEPTVTMNGDQAEAAQQLRGQLPANNYGNPLPFQRTWGGMRPVMTAQNPTYFNPQGGYGNPWAGV